MPDQNGHYPEDQEAAWQREKRGEEAMREKRTEEALREKQIEIALREKQSEARGKSSSVFLIGGIGLGLLLMLIVGATFFLNTRSAVSDVTVTINPLVAASATASRNATATITAYLDRIDRGFSNGRAALDSRNYPEAIKAFEEVKKLQQERNQENYKIVPLLFEAYLKYGDELWQAGGSYEDFKRGLDVYEKARLLGSKENTKLELEYVKNQAEIGGWYYNGLDTYNISLWEKAISALSIVYNTNAGFRDAAQLYYTALTRAADDLSKANRRAEAYIYYAKAAQLKNVSDTRYAQAQTKILADAFTQEGISLPTVSSLYSSSIALN